MEPSCLFCDPAPCTCTRPEDRHVHANCECRCECNAPDTAWCALHLTLMAGGIVAGIQYRNLPADTQRELDGD